MDHPFEPDLSGAAPPAIVPDRWDGPVIGAEDTAAEDVETRDVDDPFAPADDIGAEEPETDESGAVVASVPHGVGSVTATSTVELSTGTDSDGPDRPSAPGHTDAADPTADTAPTADDSGGDVPPEVPPIVEGDSGPDRGEALRLALAHASGANERVHDRVRAIVIGQAEDLGLLELLDGGKDLDEAIDYMGGLLIVDTNTTIREEAVQAEIAATEAEHGEAFRAAGVELSGKYNADLFIVDPAAFTEAMEQVTPPDAVASPEERAVFDKQLTNVVLEAVNRACTTITTAGPEAAITVANGDEFLTHVFSHPLRGTPTEDDIAFTQSLAAHADHLSAAMDRIDAIDPAAEPIYQLSVAQREGMLTEYAVAQRLDLIANYGGQVVGIDRLTIPRRWESVTAFFQYLRATAPDATFTEELRVFVLRDINDAVLHLPNEEPTLVRRLMLGLAEPMLRNAAANIDRLFPIQ